MHYTAVRTRSRTSTTIRDPVYVTVTNTRERNIPAIDAHAKPTRYRHTGTRYSCTQVHVRLCIEYGRYVPVLLDLARLYVEGFTLPTLMRMYLYQLYFYILHV